MSPLYISNKTSSNIVDSKSLPNFLSHLLSKYHTSLYIVHKNGINGIACESPLINIFCYYVLLDS